MIPYTIAFTVNNLNRKEVEGTNVLEVGSYNVNGSIRPVIEMRNPNRYIGVDFQEGPGVDEICTAGDLVKKFGKNSFDIVISSDTLEHILDWRDAISNIKRVCKTGGILIISVPSIGFPYHSYPHDYWRFEVKDLEVIF